MNKKLRRKQILIHWVVAAALLALGCGFALVGVGLFNALGLPVWSDGDHGWNYVGVIAYAFFVVGISLINSTLTEKVRTWIWAAVVIAALLLMLL